MAKLNVCRSYIFIIFILFINNLTAQNAKYTWNDELCSCQGTFDSTKISREQLDNTFTYLWWSTGILTEATAWDKYDLVGLNAGELQRECNAKLNELKNKKFINTPFWHKLLLARISEIESICQLKRITILAYKNPQVLKEYPQAYSLCREYTDALIEGNHKLMTTWKKLHESSVGNNMSVEKTQKEFDKMFNSADSLFYARLEVMMFGWWNCANSLIPYVFHTEKISSEFKKIFKKYDCDCNEP